MMLPSLPCYFTNFGNNFSVNVMIIQFPEPIVCLGREDSSIIFLTQGSPHTGWEWLGVVGSNHHSAILPPLRPVLPPLTEGKSAEVLCLMKYNHLSDYPGENPDSFRDRDNVCSLAHAHMHSHMVNDLSLL